MSDSWESAVLRRLRGPSQPATEAGPEPTVVAGVARPVAPPTDEVRPAAAHPVGLAGEFDRGSRWDANRRRGLQRWRGGWRSDDSPGVLLRSTTIVQRPVATGRRVQWVGVAGGVGTTTTAYAVAALMASIRGDGTAVLGAPHDLTGLPWRARQDAVFTVPGLWEDRADHATLEGLAGVACLAVPHPGTDATHRAAAVTLSRHRSYVMVDSGTGPDERVTREAHCVVIVAPATASAVDVVANAAEEVNRVAAGTPVCVVIVENVLRPTPGIDTVAGALRAAGLAVQVIPADAHLATGARVDLALVGEPARVALSRLAAGVADLCTGGRTGETSP